MVFTSSDLAIIISAFAVLLGAYATYRNSVRKVDFERLQKNRDEEIERLQERIVDTEKRLAASENRSNENERRALDSERRAEEYKNDVRQIGEAFLKERTETARRLALIVQDGNAKIQKVVIVLEKVLGDMESATGTKPDIDLDALKRLVVIDSVTGQLGPIDVQAAKRYEQTR